MTLTVTDADGGSAQSSVQIAVDRDNREPIVRVGFSQGESPVLTLHGTARRSADGGVHLPDGEPWDWGQAGDGALEGLRGLRSFTIVGWLKPDSLQVGSGGNRIVFCLNKDHSGIDLVCHTDGRLRLAANQWPDRIENESSPGKLQVGKWTLFAVTDDGTQARDNVSWYFSPPLDVPVPTTIALDRRASHSAGPVAADIGPLAIGNFNQTMHSYGLDRQFRGEIRRLQLFGGPIGRRGAFDLAQLTTHAP